MTVLRNNFAGGPDGTTISTSNSGQQGDNVFDVVSSVGTGQVTRFTNVGAANLSRPTAEYVLEISTGSTANTPYVGWTSSMGTLTQVWARFYFYITSISSGGTDIKLFSIVNSSLGSVVSFAIDRVTTPYVFSINNDWSGTASSLGSSPVVTGQWARVEMHAVLGSSGASAELYYYGGNNVDTPVYTDYVSLTGQNFTANADSYYLGHSSPALANIPTIYLSNWELNNYGYPGPAPFRQGLGVPMNNQPNPVAHHMI
jgi:hypothetical protein